ncbi:DUF6090 family protein [Formosa maritima]|uniref:Uncharacterized protein n=1 Tax=Formosa maritima TaxID=2592046 RepID=A0A5D0GF06_9FLAO|nr:DUF6090 family protein [Formosa maritima]TYA57506.1 hypothetical protein FVF61_04570 [Formosa maritima]
MIKFFRKIRYDLMNQNKTTKYFKYAIGEIILVVIGILMALQINNWNINRQNRNNEQEILKDLKVEFQENFYDAERIFVGNEDIYKAMSKIQEITQSGQYNSRQLDSLLYFAFDWFDYTPKPGASNNLINSGNLNLIQNRDLRKLLTIWSGVDDELDDDEKLAIQFSQDILIPFLAEKYPISNLEMFDNQAAFYSSKNGLNLIKNEVPRIPFDEKSLLNNLNFQSLISAKKMHARHNAMECIDVINTSSSILELIEKELIYD